MLLLMLNKGGQGKIHKISNLGTASTLTAVENKIPSVSTLVKKN